MRPERERLMMYGEASAEPQLQWAWVEQQLIDEGTYWTTPASDGVPHPRPLWGVWHDDRLFLSIGSPLIKRLAAVGASVAVNVASGIDVVIIEGAFVGDRTDQHLVDAYDAKYGWQYDIKTYGPLTEIAPKTVLAWRSAGFAGRDGFQETGRWRY